MQNWYSCSVVGGAGTALHHESPNLLIHLDCRRSMGPAADPRRQSVKRPCDEGTHGKLSVAQRRRGARPPKAGVPCSAQEDEWPRTLPNAEVVRRTGRTKTDVYNRRADLGLPPAALPGKPSPPAAALHFPEICLTASRNLLVC